MDFSSKYQYWLYRQIYPSVGKADSSSSLDCGPGSSITWEVVKMQIPGSYYRPTDLEMLGDGVQQSVF